MRLAFILSVLFIMSVNLYTQQGYTTKSERAVKFYEEGKENYRLFYYSEAEKLLLKAIDTDNKFIEPYMVLARLYWDNNRLEEAIAMYDKGLQIDPNFYTYGFFYKGTLESKVGRYADAVKSFSRLLELETKDTKLISLTKQGLAQANFAVNAVEHPVEFKPQRLGESINSADDEYWPRISADEKKLVFTRRVGSGSKHNEDFFISYWKDGKWTMAMNIGPPLNTLNDEGAQSISADGRLMVFTVCDKKGDFGQCDLYISEQRNKSWSMPSNMGSPVNSAAKEKQPGISADGRTVFFASNRSGGKGGLDIWVSHRLDNNAWSIPENLGDSVNTPGNEECPFIHPDNNTLYFSSDYWLGLGGSDIFYTRKNKQNQWQKAINIGYPINTSKDEYGLVLNAKGNIAYYSNDTDSATGIDIYTFEVYEKARPQEVTYLKGKVYDALSHKPLKAGFELYDLANGQLVSKSFSDERTGEFLVCIPTNCNYMLNVSTTGYLFYSENFSLSGVFHVGQPFEKDVPMQPVVTGQTIVLRNIFFETDSSALKPESKLELNKLVSFLNSNPSIKVEISGHTDNIGNEQYNKILSEKRAKAVVNYLIENGINTARLTSAGYGFSRPIDSNDTPGGRANNRRTELTIK